MPANVYKSGTAGAADGSLVSSGNKFAFTTVDGVVNLYVRCADDTWSSDASFAMPSDGDVEISFDGGSTWFDSSDNPIPILTGIGLGGTDLGDLNLQVKLRQHGATGTVSGQISTEGTFTACTALADVTSFAVATAGSGELALSWAAVTNRTYYRIDRATDSGFTTGVALDISPLHTTTSFTDTGRSNGTTYYYRIKAVGTYRYKDSASYATANGVPANPIFASDDFNTGSGDLVGTAPDIGGNWTDYSDSGSPSPVYASNRIRQDDAATAMTCPNTTPSSANYTVEVDVTPQSGGSGGAAGVVARKNAATGAVTGYIADYYDHATSGSRQWRLYGFSAGSLIGGALFGTYTENIGTTTKRLKLEVNGTAIKLYVDGVQRVSVTDSTISAAGRAGVVVGAAGSPATNAVFLDNFVATLL